MSKLGQLKERLVIDEDALSECLVEQPQLYYDAANSYVQAISMRDAAKLELEEIGAQLDKAIRLAAEKSGAKITEARVQQEIHLDSGYKAKRVEVLELSEQADQLQVLRDSFSQRSFMLRELVALRIAERGDIARADGAGQRPNSVALADANMRATEAERQRYRVRRRSAQ